MPSPSKVKIYLLNKKIYDEGYKAIVAGEEVIRYHDDYFVTEFRKDLDAYVINSTYGRFRY